MSLNSEFELVSVAISGRNEKLEVGVNGLECIKSSCRADTTKYI
jgi:hypothetical protein